MLGVALICLSILMISFGTLLHFWILARLEAAGIRVKYFTNIGDDLRAYRAYRDFARGRGLRVWPSYVVLINYAGVLLALIAFLLDSPLPRIAEWLGKR